MPPRRRRAIQLARLFGIRVGVSASWFVVLFVLIYWLGHDYFREMLDGSRHDRLPAWRSRPRFGYFCRSILHELGHALVARRLRHRRSPGSTCGSSAGSRSMRRDADVAGREFKVAAAGPAVTLLMRRLCVAAGVAGGLAAFTDVGSTARAIPSLTPGLALIGWLAFDQRGRCSSSTSSPPSRSTAAASRAR